MVNLSPNGYANIGGIPIGQPITSPYQGNKHLESAHFDRVMGSENQWMGILNLLQNFNKMKMPFISITELDKNVLEVDGAGSTFTFGVPFERGCPFILENLSGDDPKPGLGNKPFFILLSENAYTNGDILTTDWRNGRQLRVQTVQEKGKDAEIIPYLNGFRYMVALDGLSDDIWYPQEFLQPGIPYMKSHGSSNGEFTNEMSGYSGMDKKSALQLFQYTVGHSEQSIHTWITADATHRKLNIEKASHPMLNHLQGATMDVMQYWTPTADGKAKGVFWIPQFMQNMAAELVKMKENFLTWSQGTTFLSNGRERVTMGLGYYQQIKQRGNWDTYSDFRQLFNLVLNFSETLFSIHNMVSPQDRVVRLRAGKLAFQELRKQFSAYFKTDNPFTVFADHPALLKAKMIETDAKGGIIYRPLQFNGIFFPEQGLLLVEHDETLDNIDAYLENVQYSSYLQNSAGMVFIEDITDGNFTNAIPAGIKKPENLRNVTMIKRRGYKDTTEFKVGSGCDLDMLKMMGVTNAGNQVAGWDKGLSVRMATEGEIWVQDPSRVWLLEYDPDGTIRANYVNYGK
jgi:hypothetical protein